MKYIILPIIDFLLLIIVSIITLFILFWSCIFYCIKVIFYFIWTVKFLKWTHKTPQDVFNDVGDYVSVYWL